MPREFASPELGNLIAARLAPEEIDRRLRAPLNEAEMNEVADLVRWFCRRYPTVKDRLDYARRKMQQYQSEARASSTGLPLSAEAYEESARRLAKAHRVTDPGIVHVLLDRDPNREEIRLVEVTRSAPTTMEVRHEMQKSAEGSMMEKILAPVATTMQSTV